MTVHVTIEGFAVTLDGRALKSPSGNPLVVPQGKRLAAALIANEWENQEKILKAHSLPMVCSFPGPVGSEDGMGLSVPFPDKSYKPCHRCVEGRQN
jgi:hypothetical protein